uniref:Uncharacterized protein n=1 Tax=Triticum urartu TaxID=4572 RepID=A0A8R7QIM0_TRIUA
MTNPAARRPPWRPVPSSPRRSSGDPRCAWIRADPTIPRRAGGPARGARQRSPPMAVNGGGFAIGYALASVRMPVYAHMMYLKISVLTMTIGRATAKACRCEFLRMGIATVAATTHQQRRCSSMVPCLHLATSLLYLAMVASPTSNSGNPILLCDPCDIFLATNHIVCYFLLFSYVLRFCGYLTTNC